LLQGFSPKLARGEIAGLSGLKDAAGFFQISVLVQPGNSGGALVDAKGNVVGVINSIIDQQAALATSGALASNVAYAVKSSLLLTLIDTVPGLASKLPKKRTTQAFEYIASSVEQATCLIAVDK